MAKPLNTQITIETDDCQFGYGYKSWLYGQVNACALDPSCLANPTTQPSNQVKFSTRIATSVSQLTASLGVSAQASGTVLGAKVTGSGSMLGELAIADNQTYIVGTVAVRSTISSLAAGPFVAANLGSMSAADFVATYGDYYVSSIHSGGKLTLLVTATFASSQAKLTFDGQAAAAMRTAGMETQAGVTAAFEKLEGVSNIAIDYWCAGGEPPTGTIVGAAAALDYLTSFPASVATSPSVFAVVLSRYGETPGSPAGLLKYMEVPTLNLSDLSSTCQDYLELGVRAQRDYAATSSSTAHQKLQQRVETPLAHDLAAIKSSWCHEDPTAIPSLASLEQGANGIQPVNAYETILDNIEAVIQQVVAYGTELCLEWQGTILYVSAPKDGVFMTYPRLNQSGLSSLYLTAASAGPSGQTLNYNATVYVNTLSGDVPLRLAGASAVRALTYESLQVSRQDGGESQWTLVKRGDSGNSGPVHFGDQVYVISKAWSPERMTRHDDDYWLTTVDPSDDSADSYWTIVPVPMGIATGEGGAS